jgi:hypothetical protein
LHIVLVVTAVWAGVLFYRLAVGTLRWDERESFLWKRPFKKVTTYKRGVVAITLGVLVLLLSLGTINGVRSHEFRFNDVRTWMPYVFEFFGFSPFANFREKDVSTKPSNWSGKPEENLLVKGAPLRGRNLRYADGYRAFLVKSDLRKADLRGANLQEANLGGTNLLGAYLSGANLQQADLREANLQGANFLGADLWAANLQGGRNLTVKQLSEVKTLYKAELDQELETQIKEEYSHLLEESKPEK